MDTSTGWVRMSTDEGITPLQCRLGRYAAGWSQFDLAQAARVAERTVMDFESGSRRPTRATRANIARALRERGVELLTDEGVVPPSDRRRAALSEARP